MSISQSQKNIFDIVGFRNDSLEDFVLSLSMTRLRRNNTLKQIWRILWENRQQNQSAPNDHLEVSSLSHHIPLPSGHLPGLPKPDHGLVLKPKRPDLTLLSCIFCRVAMRNWQILLETKLSWNPANK